MQAKGYELVHLDPAAVRFQRSGDTLRLDVGGVHYPRVVLRSAFPVSDGRLFLSVREASTEDQEEIGMLEQLDALDEESRDAVAAELRLHYFVPRVLRVNRIREEFGFLYWSVETDKGPKDFVMRDSVVHYAREVGPGHWLIIDVGQARYEIPDIDALDAPSRKLVRRYLRL